MSFGIVLSNKKFLFASCEENIDHGYYRYYIHIYDMQLKESKGKYGYIRNPILIDEHSFIAKTKMKSKDGNINLK